MKYTGSQPEPDTRMVRCVIGDHVECPAKIPAACICNQMPKQAYLDALKVKYPIAEDD